VTVDLKDPKPVKVRLENGRRTEAAYVPPPSAQQEVEAAVESESSDQVLFQLRNISSREVTSFQGVNNRGASYGGMPRSERLPAKSLEPNKDDRVLYQTRMSSIVKDSLDLTAQAIVSADRRSVRVTVQPVFNTAATDRPITAPVVTNPVLPGSGN